MMDQDTKNELRQYLIEMVATGVSKLIEENYSPNKALETTIEMYKFLLNEIDFKNEDTFRAIIFNNQIEII